MLNRKAVKHFCFIFFAGLILVSSACAPVQKEKKRYFFPVPPAEPRLEYLGFIQSDHDVRNRQTPWLEDFILGSFAPQPVFQNPYDVASDGKGRVFVTDLELRTVLILDTEKGEIRYLADKRGHTVPFATPFAVAVDSSGRIAVSDVKRHKVLLFGQNERILRVLNLGESSHPVGLAFSNDGSKLFVADSAAHQILVYGDDGQLIQRLGERGVEGGQFNYPLDVDVDHMGQLYVLDSMNFRVQVFSPDLEFVRDFGEQGTAAGSFKIPKGVGLSPSGLVYVSDALAHKFVVFSDEGRYLLSLGGKKRITTRFVVPGGMYMPRGIDVDDNDTLWVVDSLNRTLHRFQYLSDAYLEAHPILPGQAFVPNVR